MQLTIDHDTDVIELPEAEIVMTITDHNRQEWLAERRFGIGGSEAAGLMRLSKYTSPMIIAMDKMGMVPEFEGNTYTDFGNALEPFLRDRLPEAFASIGVLGVSSRAHPYLLQSKTYPFMRASLDGITIHPEHDLCVSEFKTAGEHLIDQWADDAVPDAYYTQVQHNMVVAGLRMAVVYALVGRTFVLRLVPRNDAFCADLIELERVFWTDYVEKGIIPDPIGIEAEDAYLLDRYPDASSDEVVAADDIAPLAEEYLELNARLKDMEARKRELSQVFKSRIGDRKVAKAGEHRITWSRFDRSTFDREQLERDYPDIAGKYVQSQTSQRLLVK